MKPIVQNFKKEQSLQAAISTIEVIRNKYPKGKKDGRSKTYYTKAELQRIKPSDLLVREEVEQEGREEVVVGGGAPGYDDFEI